MCNVQNIIQKCVCAYAGASLLLEASLRGCISDFLCVFTHGLFVSVQAAELHWQDPMKCLCMRSCLCGCVCVCVNVLTTLNCCSEGVSQCFLSLFFHDLLCYRERKKNRSESLSTKIFRYEEILKKKSFFNTLFLLETC